MPVRPVTSSFHKLHLTSPIQPPRQFFSLRSPPSHGFSGNYYHFSCYAFVSFSCLSWLQCLSLPCKERFLQGLFLIPLCFSVYTFSLGETDRWHGKKNHRLFIARHTQTEVSTPDWLSSQPNQPP